MIHFFRKPTGHPARQEFLVLRLGDEDDPDIPAGVGRSQAFRWDESRNPEREHKVEGFVFLIDQEGSAPLLQIRERLFDPRGGLGNRIFQPLFILREHLDHSEEGREGQLDQEVALGEVLSVDLQPLLLPAILRGAPSSGIIAPSDNSPFCPGLVRRTQTPPMPPMPLFPPTLLPLCPGRITRPRSCYYQTLRGSR